MARWKMKLILCLLLIWLILIINPKVLAQTPNDPDIILNLNTLSPYSGVLVNPQRYRELSIDKIEAENFKTNIAADVGVTDSPLNISLFSSAGGLFVVSLGITCFVLGAVLEHNLR